MKPRFESLSNGTTGGVAPGCFRNGNRCHQITAALRPEFDSRHTWALTIEAQKVSGSKLLAIRRQISFLEGTIRNAINLPNLDAKTHLRLLRYVSARNSAFPDLAETGGQFRTSTTVEKSTRSIPPRSRVRFSRFSSWPVAKTDQVNAPCRRNVSPTQTESRWSAPPAITP